MVRASDISALSEFVLEEHREALRDRRWERRCQVAQELAVPICKCLFWILMTVLAVLRALGML